jgi:hypothetical protein
MNSKYLNGRVDEFIVLLEVVLDRGGRSSLPKRVHFFLLLLLGGFTAGSCSARADVVVLIFTFAPCLLQL